jgi:DNA (cytosine-5)-methyltransferase 1
MSGRTVLSAFSGAGGLDLGLEHAGFRTIGCIEWDAAARRTIETHGRWPLVAEKDIRQAAAALSPARFGLEPGKLGVLAGGPPCQPFSKAAQWAQTGMAGLEDERSKCVWAFFKIAAAFLPRVILIENVPGFVTGRNSAIPAITAMLDDINARYATTYRLSYACLNAADYGVPQRRERAILVALRNGCEFDWPILSHVHRPVRAYDAIGELACPRKPLASGKWAALLPSIPEGQNYLHHTANGNGKPLFGYRTRFWSFLLKLAKDEPAWTISAQPGPATGPFHWENRPLTIVEMLRLQTFPADWPIQGDRRAQVRQIGNATPPLFAEAIGRAIGKQVFGVVYKGALTLRIPRKRSIPRRARLQGVPQEYDSLLGAHKPHGGTGKGPRARKPVAEL